MIYDRLENYHKLTNIIWVWNGQNPHTAIHPNAFDIEGIDRYYDQEDISAEALSTYYEKCYGELAGYDKYCAELAGMESTGKMMALTECGYIPDPEGIKAANTMWLYYMATICTSLTTSFRSSASASARYPSRSRTGSTSG